MANEKISPEERLFNIIRDQKNQKDGKKSHAAPDFLRALLNVFKLRAKSLWRLVPAGRFSALAFDIHDIDVKALNKILTAILAFITAAALFNIIDNKLDITKISKGIAGASRQGPDRKSGIELFKPFDFYSNLLRKRNIFIASSDKEAQIGVSQRSAQAPAVAEILKEIKLKGIAWGKYPKVIIKNEKEDKVYFLTEGQMIGSTGIEIKVILKHKVIIRYNDEELELI